MNLVEIIRQLTAADGRATRELPRGLHLVYYPPADGRPAHHLIIGRYSVLPSIAEMSIIHDTLLEALDAHPSRVVTDIDTSWSETTRGDWYGVQIAWQMLPTIDAFSHDPELRQRVRLALEQREQRQLKRREQQRARKTRPSTGRGPKPML